MLFFAYLNIAKGCILNIAGEFKGLEKFSPREKKNLTNYVSWWMCFFYHGGH